MCRENKEFFFMLFLFLLFCFVVGVLRAEEQESWYLISETELRSIENYKANKEQETQNLLSQVRVLNMRAENSEKKLLVSEARSARLEADSMTLNQQLSQDREQKRKLEQSFNEYERDQLILVSSKNGEISDLKQDIATEKEKVRVRDKVIFWLALAVGYFLLGKIVRLILWLKNIKLPRLLEIILL